MTSRVRFQIKAKGLQLWAEHPEYGLCKIATGQTPEGLTAMFLENWRDVQFETPTSGTFEAFSELEV